jgi:hypothetical protein
MTASGAAPSNTGTSLLAAPGRARDRLAGQIKGELDAAAFANAPVHGAAGLTVAWRALIGVAEHLASGG